MSQILCHTPIFPVSSLSVQSSAAAGIIEALEGRRAETPYPLLMPTFSGASLTLSRLP